MKTCKIPITSYGLVWALFCCPIAANAAENVDGITAVASKVSASYVRAKLPNGQFVPEYYCFGQGGVWGGEIKDETIDKLHFTDIARMIAVPLANQKYINATDPHSTRLLIMVYWGTTAVPESTENSAAVSNFKAAEDNLRKYTTTSISGSQVTGGGGAADAAMAQWSAALTELNVANQQRSRTDFANAAMLGYDSPGLIGTDYGRNMGGTAIGSERDDLYSEIEENRYFVVLMAYDFQLMWRQKKHKLLWETRFSIRERNHQFDRDLPSMAQYASQYFGQETHGLIRKAIPLGNVEIGKIDSLGEIEPPVK